MTVAIIFSGIVGIGIAATASLVVRKLGVDAKDAFSLFTVGAFAAIVSVFLLIIST